MFHRPLTDNLNAIKRVLSMQKLEWKHLHNLKSMAHFSGK